MSSHPSSGWRAFCPCQRNDDEELACESQAGSMMRSTVNQSSKFTDRLEPSMKISARNIIKRRVLMLVLSLDAASLARKVYMKQNIGVGAFSRQYGGRNKRKGTVPEHFARASRGLIRHILKQVPITPALLLLRRPAGMSAQSSLWFSTCKDLSSV